MLIHRAHAHAALIVAGTPALVEMLQTLIKSSAAGNANTVEGMRMLASLPWAQHITPDAITALVTEAINNKVHSVLPLLQLPGTRQLGAGVVLDSLTKAVHAGLPEVTRELGRCVKQVGVLC